MRVPLNRSEAEKPADSGRKSEEDAAAFGCFVFSKVKPYSCMEISPPLTII